MTLTITAPVAHAKLERSPLGRGFVPVTFGLLLLPFSRKLRKRMGKLASVALLMLAGVAATAGLTGCGTTTGFFAKPQQTYTVTITGTSGTLSHSTTVTLTVE